MTPLPALPVAPMAGLEVRAMVALLPGPLGGLTTPPWLLALLAASAEAPLRPTEDLRKAVRDVLRQRGYRPTGRGKPSSEYLAKAAAEGRLTAINPLVDAGNAVSLHSGMPISVVDLDRTDGHLEVRVAAAGDSYAFNTAGQVIDVAFLPCLWDAAGPCANAVKDAQRTKTLGQTRRVLALVWGSAVPEPDRPGRTAEWLAEVLRRLGCEVSVVATVDGVPG